MGFWRKAAVWLGFTRDTGETFTVDTGSIDPALFGLSSYTDPIAPAPAISRREAIQVPAVKRGRDLICGTIGKLPFRQLDTENVEHISTLLSQPESFCARSITFTRTVEDMLFCGQAWWWIRQYSFTGYPVRVTKVPGDSKFDEDKNVLLVGDLEIPARDLIKFDSPTDGVLAAGARAIRTYLKLVAAADRYADEPMPSGYFTPKPESDPAEPDVQEFLDAWGEARRKRATAYVPAVVDYNAVQWNPEQLQMDQSRQAAVLEIARVIGIDAEDLQVSTTSRTYVNSQDRRLAMINDTLGMYVSAVEERLSMPDVTPRGYRVVADFYGFLRADDKTRFEAYTQGVALGLYDRDAIAAREGLPQPTFPAPQQKAIEAGTNA